MLSEESIDFTIMTIYFFVFLEINFEVKEVE